MRASFIARAALAGGVERSAIPRTTHSHNPEQPHDPRAPDSPIGAPTRGQQPAK